MNLLRFFKKDLSIEVKSWVHDSLITQDQGQLILNKYGIDYSDDSDRKLGTSILLSLASLLIGLAVIVVLGENWNSIPKLARVFSLGTSVLSLHLIGLTFLKQNKERLAHAFFLLGSILYGASIFLIAQIYHINAHYPDGVLYWILGILPFIYILKSRTFLFCALILTATWAILEFQLGYHPSWYFVFAALFSWFLFKIKYSLFLFILNYASIVFFILCSINSILKEQSYFLNFKNIHLYIFIDLLIISCLVSLIFRHKVYSEYLRKYFHSIYLLSLQICIFTLFIFSFKYPWRRLFEASTTYESAIFINGIFIFSILILTFFYLKKFLNIDKLLNKHRFIIIMVSFYSVLCSSISLINSHTAPIYFQVIANALLFTVGLKTILHGLSHHRAFYFYSGISIILTQIFCRYFDLIGSYIGASALFLISGLVMLLAAKYWNECKIKTISKVELT